MSDRVFFSLSAALVIIMIGLALVWPQGLGVKSPPPFGHALIMPDVVRHDREKLERDKKKKTGLEAQKSQAPSDQSAMLRTKPRG